MDSATVEVVHKGVFLILLATLCIVLMNTCAKVSSVAHGPVEMVFYRGVVALGLLVPFMLATRPVSVFRTRRIGAHLYRAAVGNIGVGLVFWAYSLLPMANATAMLFAAPLFVTALSPLLLAERVGPSRYRHSTVGQDGGIPVCRSLFPGALHIYRDCMGHPGRMAAMERTGHGAGDDRDRSGDCQQPVHSAAG